MSQITQQPQFGLTGIDGLEGKWVAIRDGEVIASADSLAELHANDNVTRDDAVYVVPESNSAFF
jgi:hypothetical protein